MVERYAIDGSLSSLGIRSCTDGPKATSCIFYYMLQPIANVYPGREKIEFVDLSSVEKIRICSVWGWFLLCWVLVVGLSSCRRVKLWCSSCVIFASL